MSMETEQRANEPKNAPLLTHGRLLSSGSSHSSIQDVDPVPMESFVESPGPSFGCTWFAYDTFFQFSNTYYAGRLALVTVSAWCCLVIGIVFFRKHLETYLPSWLFFQLLCTMLGCAALPCIRLYKTTDDTSSSFSSHIRSQCALHVCEVVMIVQRVFFLGVLFIILCFLVIVIVWFATPFEMIEQEVANATIAMEHSGSASGSFESGGIIARTDPMAVDVSASGSSPSSASGSGSLHSNEIEATLEVDSRSFFILLLCVVFSVLCMYLQMRYFDQLRAHQQAQLGAGLNTTMKSLGQPTMPSHPIESSQASSIASNEELRLQPQDKRIVSSLRKRLFEAAMQRNHRAARRLLHDATRELGSPLKLQLLLLRMYKSPMLFLWAFAKGKRNPLHVACRLGDATMVQILLEAGMNVNALDKIMGPTFDLQLIYEIFQSRIKHLTNVLGSPLHVAVLHGHVHIIHLLAQHGASLDNMARTSFFSKSMRVPPIFFADSERVMECLIHHRANFLLVPGKRNHMTVTVLQRALLKDRAELVTILEEWGGDFALTPLHEASAAGDIATVKHLLSFAIDPDVKGEFQDGIRWRTPLHWASVMGRNAVMMELLKSGADVNAKDRLGRTPLHWATRHNHPEAVKILLEHGAESREIDHFGLTPLAFGVVGGLVTDACVAQYQADVRVDINQRLYNADEDTCLHLALKHGHRATAMALLQTGNADLCRLNGANVRAVDCCASAQLEYEVKRFGQVMDIVLSYEPTYQELAERIRDGIQANWITVAMREGTSWSQQLMDWIPQASALVCIISSGYETNVMCMEELASAKQHQIPVVAISCDAVNISEDLQVYLYTRQIVPFRDAIQFTKDHQMEIDDDKFTKSLQNLIDGLRDEVELHRKKPVDATDFNVQSPMGPNRLSGLRLSSSRRLYRHQSPYGTPRFTNHSHRTMEDVVQAVLRTTSSQNQPPKKKLPVFVAHGDRHGRFVLQLYRRLQQEPMLQVVMDAKHKYSSMKDRMLAAKDAILQSAIVIVVLSHQNVERELICDQLAFAEDKGKILVPIIYIPQAPTITLDATISRLLKEQHVHQLMVFDADLSYGRGFDELVDAMEYEVEEEDDDEAKQKKVDALVKKAAHQFLNLKKQLHQR